MFDEINTYFDHIYVLTIKRATDRHQSIQHQLQGLNYSLFFGTDKQALSTEQLISAKVYDPVLAQKNHRYNKEMKPGEIACSLGHKAIYEDMVNKNFSKVLILEDDVIVNKDGIGLFSSIFSEIPGNWDIIYFDYNKHINNNLFTQLKKIVYHIQKKLGQLKLSHRTIRNLYAISLSKHVRKAGYHDYTSAYAITRSAAEKLIELQSPVSFPSDHLLAYAVTNEYIKGFITIPKLFIQLSQQKQSDYTSYVE